VSYKDLREFVARLEREGELKRTGAEVDVDLEVTEIINRVCKSGGPAVLFERPRSAKDGVAYSVPLLINLLGSERRMVLALEASSLEDVARRIEELLEMRPPEGFFEKVRLLPKLAELGSFLPKTVKSGPAKEVIETREISLARFPIMKCWPQDAGRFITFPMVITRSPKTGRRNVGCYRMQVYDERTTAMHWQIHKGGAEHFRWVDRIDAEGKGGQGRSRRMDVAVAIGADPVTMLSGILPLPQDLDEFLFAGFLRKEPVEMVKCETVDLEVPANSEIVLEGFVDLDDVRVEGPFGDHAG
jgi:4-hydroxy-3-polyprenylbenzoate decarboxylase